MKNLFFLSVLISLTASLNAQPVDNADLDESHSATSIRHSI